MEIPENIVFRVRAASAISQTFGWTYTIRMFRKGRFMKHYLDERRTRAVTKAELDKDMRTIYNNYLAGIPSHEESGGENIVLVGNYPPKKIGGDSGN